MAPPAGCPRSSPPRLATRPASRSRRAGPPLRRAGPPPDRPPRAGGAAGPPLGRPPRAAARATLTSALSRVLARPARGRHGRCIALCGAAGAMAAREASVTEGSVFRSTPMERVQEGMVVLDESGKRLGAVEYLKLGDPDAVTDRGERLSDPASSAVERIAEVLPFTAEREPRVPEPLRGRLLRVGFLKVDGPGLAD